MAGIYLHIPYCKKACHYCDFHFSTQFDTLEKVVEAMCKELELKKHRFSEEPIQSIYFGGGTPSAVPSLYIDRLLQKASELFQISPNAEITIEANPDDLHKSKIKEIQSLGVNRFSIGIQSFFDEDLQWMNRAHNAQEAQNCIRISQEIGFEDISIDLIYGFPMLSSDKWIYNIEQALSFQVPHISCYQLTVEPKTALAFQIKKGVVQEPNDEISLAQMETLIETLTQNGYEHYEISNFALPSRYAVHNTNYWKNLPYLGVGPSSHSYAKGKRMWNVADNRKYYDAILNLQQIPETIEILTLEDQYNEKVMTGLRTQWGINSMDIENEFGKRFSDYFQKLAKKFVEKDLLNQNKQTFRLTNEGKKIADFITSEFFMTNKDIISQH